MNDIGRFFFPDGWDITPITKPLKCKVKLFFQNLVFGSQLLYQCVLEFGETVLMLQFQFFLRAFIVLVLKYFAF